MISNRTSYSLIIGALVIAIAVAAILLSIWLIPRYMKHTGKLEDRLKEIDNNLAKLPDFTLQSGIGPVGYRSHYTRDRDVVYKIKVDWKENQPIEQVVIVPLIHRAPPSTFQSIGFPVEFTITYGTEGSKEGKLLAKYTQDDELLPRIAPVVIPCPPGTVASWVRFDAEELTKGRFDERLILKLSEIMVFNGDRNVALEAEVTTNSPRLESPPWRAANLTDGFIPYLMYTNDGNGSPSAISALGAGDPAVITMDLGETRTIDRIQLHTAEVNDNIPMVFDSRFGVPRHLLIEGSMNQYFTNPVELLSFKNSSSYQTGPIISRNIPPTPCRYVRLIAMEPYVPDREDADRTRFGFAEIELFEGDDNVAEGIIAETNFELDYYVRNTGPLTDGSNLYGSIIPIRQWLNQLEERHELNRERPVVITALNSSFSKQRNIVAILITVVTTLVILVLLEMIIAGYLRRRAIDNTRERIAADIHDELGANLHAIGLMGNLAEMMIDDPEKQKGVLQRLQNITRRAGQSAKHCINLLERKSFCEDLVEDMKRTAERLLADMDSNIQFKGEELLNRLKYRIRVDVFLFYKECLTNILRHSGASTADIIISMTPNLLQLSILDNGQPSGVLKNHEVPKSLKRRARLMGAKVNASRPKSGGTCIELKLPLSSSSLEKR